MTSPMTTTEAILYMRERPEYHDLLTDAYLLADADAEVERFASSVELSETLAVIPNLTGTRVLDLGAGTAMASRALAQAGAAVIALEPELDDVVGLGVLRRGGGADSVLPVGGLGSAIPLADGSVDVVYCRQVLHHIADLPASLAECARVLRPGGHFVATREHVVDDDAQLAAFRADHPVHQLAGGEGAWSLDRYRDAIVGAGLELSHVLGPWDSLINAFPTVRSASELARGPQIVVGQRLGPVGASIAGLPGIRHALWRVLKRRKPGRLYSFVAEKPHDGSARA